MELFSQAMQYMLLVLLLSFYLITITGSLISRYRKHFNKLHQPSIDVLNFYTDSLDKGAYLGETVLSIAVSDGVNKIADRYTNEDITAALLKASTNKTDVLKAEYPAHYFDDAILIFNLNFDANGYGNELFINDKSLSEINFINTIHISNKDIQLFEFENINIPTLYIHHQCTSINIKLTKCNIGTLIIEGYPNTKHHTRNFIINNTNIGTLTLKEFCVHSFSMKGGSILNIECPNVNEDAPFIGDVSFKDVFLPIGNLYSVDRFTIQGYRNIQYHLQNMQATLASNLFHTLELRAERKFEPKTNKTISYLYDWFSEYGSSILKPFMWLFSFWIISIAIFYLTDGLETLDPKATKLYVGWRNIFTEIGAWAILSKSMYQSLINIVNPLGIFGVKSLLIPKYGILTVWSIIHSLFSVTFITLTLFAIRRRFKLQ